MKRLIMAVIAAALGSGSAEAAVSGYYDSVEQIGVILGSSEVADAVHQAPIGAISNTGTRKDGAKEWTIRVQECDLKVYLIPVLPDGPGKTTYRLDIPGSCE
ncbi:hypothetical protein [Rhizobium sp. FKL33]|uniref:hypothetical protein n=1 Tax=Rhizobium sp. FKL33 TaxID=2562307 RepID=UPI0010C0FFD4|nr:hypothetical protein [Rhizobium sp. FKL33]